MVKKQQNIAGGFLFRIGTDHVCANLSPLFFNTANMGVQLDLFKQEIWRDIPDFEGYYQASSWGRIKSLPRKKVNKERVLKPCRCSNDYLMVSLCKNSLIKQILVHRLVMAAFHGASNNHVNHKDFDKTNNRLDNLEYCTERENMKHYFSSVKTKSSSYVGVSYNKRNKKWEVSIQHKGIKHYFGKHNTEQDAINIHKENLKLFI